eukprot:92580_1
MSALLMFNVCCASFIIWYRFIRKTAQTDLFQNNNQCKSNHKVKIIVPGFVRTGTVSLSLAFKRLNVGKVCHIGTNTYDENMAYLPWWIGKHKMHQNNEYIDYEEFFSKFKIDIAMDWPLSFYWKEILNVYPSAKVIVCVRDIDPWHTSINYLFDTLRGPVIYFMACLDPIFGEVYSVWWHQCVDSFGGRHIVKDKDLLRKKQTLIIEDIKRTMGMKAKAHNLLIYNPIKSGWKPLCDFLDLKTIPNEPFPHANTAAEFYKNTVVYSALCKIYELLGLRRRMRR